MAKNMKISFLLDFYGAMLTEKQREVIEYYYNDDLSLSEIAENEGISRQGVRDAIKRAEAQLVEMEERLGFAERFCRVRDTLTLVRGEAEKIAACNRRCSSVREIGESAEHILAAVRVLEE